MVRLRKKKIIRLKKKNPAWKIDKNELPADFIEPETVSNKLIKALSGSVLTCNVKELCEAITLWNSGSYCLDCYNRLEPGKPVPYYRCSCEKCYECAASRCICPLEVSCYSPYELGNKYEDTAKVAWEFIKLVFSDKQTKDFKKINLLPYYQEDFSHYVFDDIMKSNSLKKPSYPKYKKIAEELFRL